ncbi:MAG: hypothetical protein E7645_04225 [Ruminococcaceae bacterium]|nr:hypothetical protein [Oscillospiraceae bacterium]
MYSRFNDMSSFLSGARREPSYRQSVRIPPNYHGTAIGATPPDGVPPATEGVVLPPIQEQASPTDVLSEDTFSIADASESHTEDTPVAVSAAVSGGKGLWDRFPFGHGFGFEELLLLGLILFLLREGGEDGKNQEENDLNMTIFLLGALLFLG